MPNFTCAANMTRPVDSSNIRELALRGALQALPGAAAAALYAAAAGVIAGIFGCVLAGSLAFGVRSALAGFVIAVAGAPTDRSGARSSTAGITRTCRRRRPTRR